MLKTSFLIFDVTNIFFICTLYLYFILLDTIYTTKKGITSNSKKESLQTLGACNVWILIILGSKLSIHTKITVRIMFSS